WGITACDGPGNVTHDFQGAPRTFYGYAGRGMGGPSTRDDGTIAPYAAGSSVAFTPELSLPALAAMYARYGGGIYGRYGLFGFNPSFTFTDVAITNGGVMPGLGWVNSDFLGIELGPLLAMIGNYRGELVWKTMRRHPAIKRGLLGAGFTGGWLG
ncbi:MAG TPA: glucoamylase family protein, partial [Myxococcaceae bacterium]|nr:glucoamylase family protein [Myxococcaceae bacterium]